MKEKGFEDYLGPALYIAPTSAVIVAMVADWLGASQMVVVVLAVLVLAPAMLIFFGALFLLSVEFVRDVGAVMAIAGIVLFLAAVLMGDGEPGSGCSYEANRSGQVDCSPG